MNAIDLTAQVVSAYLAGNKLGKTKLPDLIVLVHDALTNPILPTRQPRDGRRPVSKPAVLPHESVFSDHLVCLEDGKCVKMLKRHLMTMHEMTPSQYRAKWELPPNYPMTASDYVKQRSKIAKETGLGKKR